MTTATKAAADKRKTADKEKDKAVKRQEAIDKANAEYREDVRKAAEKLAKALAKVEGGNIAETAWNETKSDEDPLYKDSAPDHRRKLDTAVEAIKTSGSAGIVGLEDFEARVIELLKEAGTPAGTVVPFIASAAPPVAPVVVADSAKKAGKPSAHK